MKIAICQSEIQYLNVQENLRYAMEQIHEASLHHAACIVFPEMSFTGFSMDAVQSASYGLQTCQQMQQCAVHEKIMIGFGWVQLAENGQGENHYSFVDHYGNLILDYIKIHPFSYAQEDQYFRAGTSLPYVQNDPIPFFCAICYDLRFPELFRLRARETNLVFVPANWPEQRIAQWQALLVARAIENQMYVIGVNCTGTQDGTVYTGHSMAVAPDGQILCDCHHLAGIYYTEVYPEKVLEVRKKFPVLSDIRPDLYQKL
jgi:predicted amidohydrolase